MNTTPFKPSANGRNGGQDFVNFMELIMNTSTIASTNQLPPDAEAIVVCDKYEVPMALYMRVGKAQEDILPALMKGTKYTTADICGDEFWGSLSSSERRFAYLCLKHIMGISAQLQFLGQEEGKPRYFQLG